MLQAGYPHILSILNRRRAGHDQTVLTIKIPASGIILGIQEELVKY